MSWIKIKWINFKKKLKINRMKLKKKIHFLNQNRSMKKTN